MEVSLHIRAFSLLSGYYAELLGSLCGHIFSLFTDDKVKTSTKKLLCGNEGSFL